MYFKTGIQVQSTNPQTSYTITLSDNKGVVSDVFTAELKKKFKVTFNSQDGSPVPAQYIENNGKVTRPTDPTKTGYIFDGWYKDADCSDGQKWNFATDTVTSNITLYAKWTAGSGTEYRVEHYRQKIADDSYEWYVTDVQYGTTGATIVADTIKKNYEGFDYDHMYPESPTIAADESTVVRLYYNRKTYQVDFRVDGLGGTISAAVTGAAVSESPVTVKYDGSVTFTATPADGYAVDSWSSNVVDISTDKTTATLSNVKEITDKTVTVKFKKVYKVTFEVVDGEGGKLQGSYGGLTKIATGGNTEEFTNVSHGTTVEFTATPDPGWKVEGWTLNNESVSGTNVNYTSPGIAENTTVTVEFKKVTAVAGTDNLAWTLLKNAVKVADPNSTITIDGRIGATSGNSGEIEIDETLTIEGKTGPDKDILDANGLSRIFKVASGKTLTLKNLTLTGGKATGTGDAGSGGAIFARDANDIKIINCIITGNEADTNGGGLNVEGTPTTITNCTFTGNTAKNGGGIYINKAGKIPAVTIEGGTIGGTGTNEANEATGTGSDGNGGGIYVGNLCKVILQNNDSTGCTIKGNIAYTNGGGVYANNADVIMSGRTRIAVDNDVYLDDDSLIKVFNTLTAPHPVARITVPKDNYKTGTQVLDGNAVGSQHTKFAVTPKDGGDWEVNRSGFLKPKY